MRIGKLLGKSKAYGDKKIIYLLPDYLSIKLTQYHFIQNRETFGSLASFHTTYFSGMATLFNKFISIKRFLTLKCKIYYRNTFILCIEKGITA